MGTRVVVFTAPGCHLCGPAVETVRAVCGRDYAVVDISADTALERQYRQRIPVVEVDGAPAFTYVVDEHELRALLRRQVGGAHAPG